MKEKKFKTNGYHEIILLKIKYHNISPVFYKKTASNAPYAALIPLPRRDSVTSKRQKRDHSATEHNQTVLVKWHHLS